METSFFIEIDLMGADMRGVGSETHAVGWE